MSFSYSTHQLKLCYALFRQSYLIHFINYINYRKSKYANKFAIFVMEKILPDKRILQRGELISFLVAIIVINRREFIDPIYLTIRCAGTPKKNRLEQLVPSSKVIVAHKHSGPKIAKADPVAGWHTFSENLRWDTRSKNESMKSIECGNTNGKARN